MKKKYRIKKNQEILSLMKKKQIVSNEYFILYFQKNNKNMNFRFALSVSKKYGKAYERNLMKRRMREIIRLYSYPNDVDFFLIVKMKAKDLNFNELKIAIEALLMKADLLKER